MQAKVIRIHSPNSTRGIDLPNAVFKGKSSVAISTIHFILKKIGSTISKGNQGIRFHFMKKCRE
jgi:hypothetical protein